MNLFLRLSSLFIILCYGCARPYKNLENKGTPSISAIRFKPVYHKVLYRCTVNGHFLFKKYHLSGLLLFKTMQNGGTHAVFQNEMGYTFFDFEWDNEGFFKVRSIIPQLDKQFIINSLHKDMAMFLMKELQKNTEILYTSRRGKEQYYRYTINTGYVFYITEAEKLKRIENADEKKKVTTIDIWGKKTDEAMPDSAFFNHHKAKFTIALDKIEDHVDE